MPGTHALRPKMRSILQHLALVLVCASPTAQTYVVDARGGGHFTDLGVAVATVPSGAVLRVRAGVYGPFTLAHKSLTILGDDATVWTIQQAVVIGPTTAAQRVVIDGLTIMPRPDDTVFDLRLRGLAGPCHLERLRVTGATLASSVFVEDCADVRMVDCDLSAGMHPGFARLDATNSCLQLGHCRIVAGSSTVLGRGVPAIRAVRSRLACIGCDVQGGAGSPSILPLFPPPGAGGPGIELVDASLELSGVLAQVTGGPGGSIVQGTGAGAAGGSGLLATRSTIASAAVSLRGGAGGTGSTGNGQTGPPMTLDGASSARMRSETGPGLRVLDRLTAGGTTRFELSGGPGDVCALALGTETHRAPLPWQGFGLLALQPVWWIAPAQLPASGRLVLTVPVPFEWPRDTPLWLQVASQPAGLPEAWLSNPASAILRS